MLNITIEKMHIRIATKPDRTADEVVPRVHPSDLATFVAREFVRRPA